MAKNDVLKKLRKEFGLPEEGDFDPEGFLLRLGAKIMDNTAAVNIAIQDFKKIGEDTARAVETLAGINGLQTEIKKMCELHAALELAIKTQDVKVVQVEKVVERPPDKIKIEATVKEDAEEKEKSRSWLTKTILALFKEPVDALVQMLMNEIRASRTEEGAIAVRLVTANGESFYNAMLSVSGGGGAAIPNPLPTTHGKTLKTFSGTTSSSGNNTVVSAVASKRIKTYSFALTTVSTTVNTVYFRDGTAGAELRRYILQAPSGPSTVGANDSVNPDAFLFGTTAGNALILNLSAAVAVHYAGAYWDDDAT